MPATISATSTRALADAAALRGVRVGALLAQHGVAHGGMGEAGARIPAEKVPGIWRALMAASRDPALPLAAAEALPFGAYRVIDYMASTSGDVAQGMGRLSAYFRLINNGARLPILSLGGLHGVGLSSHLGQAPLTSAYVEYTFAVTLVRFRSLCRGDLNPAAMRFTFPRPAHAGAYATLFRCPLHFDQPANAMLFSEADWLKPHRNPDPGMCDVLESHARILAEGVPELQTLAHGVRAAIGERLLDGEPRLDGVAAALGIGTRTLQRRLREEGLSYRALVDDVRRERASLYLADPSISLCEVAFMLGFSEQSAFHRAFRRWTGAAPGAWRAQHLGAQSA